MFSVLRLSGKLNELLGLNRMESDGPTVNSRLYNEEHMLR